MISRLRCGTFVQRMRADADKGSAAIEFAFIAPIFFVLLLGTFEASIMFFAQSTLQNAVTESSRQIRTGQSNCASKDADGKCVAMTQTQFRDMICGKISPLLACDERLQIDVGKYANYGAARNGTPLIDQTDPQGNKTGAKVLDPGLNRFVTTNACDVMLVRAFYSWDVAAPGMSYFLVNMAGGRHLIAAAAAFRNEPYNNGLSGC